MTDTPTILSVFAHPDDETFLAGGTMALFQERGSRVVICSMTRGEEGEIAEGVPATRENLGEFREAELRDAMAALGITDVRFFGYRDSGMQGTATNDAPAAFMKVPVEESGRRVADVINEVQPDIVIAFGPEGVYLHPDHVAAHWAVMEAIRIAASDDNEFKPAALLFATSLREWFIELWNIEGNPFAEMPFEQVEQMGVPQVELTHFVDVTAYREQLFAALRAHASQFGTGDPFEWLPEHLAVQFARYDHYQQASLPWNGRGELPEVFQPLT